MDMENDRIEEEKSGFDWGPRNSVDYPSIVFNYLQKIPQSEKDILQYHQRVVYEYFTKNPNARGVLVFHGTGTGKTRIAAAISETLKKNSKIVIFSAASLRHNFSKDLRSYMRAADPSLSDAAIEDNIATTYSFVSINSSNMYSKVAALRKTEEEIEYEKSLGVLLEVNLEGCTLIFDEAQNFFNAVVNGSKNAVALYSAMMKTRDLRIVYLSATPCINDPFELMPCFNTCAGYELLPTDYDEFYELFVDTANNRVKNREKLKNRLYALTSYNGDWWRTGGVAAKPGDPIKRDGFPDQMPIIVERVPMSPEQFAAYSHARELESVVKKKRVTIRQPMQKPKSDPGSTYRVASRQISNFWLPDFVKVKRIGEYGFDKHIDRITPAMLADLSRYSPKMERILTNADKHPGLSVVYSSFVSGEGLKIFSRVLDHHGWREYDPARPKKPGERVYAFYTGQQSPEERAAIQTEFNKPQNRDGASIDMLLLSGAGAEGVDLKNVMSIHLMEPYWNWGRIEQIIARGCRYLSHNDYPPDRRVIQPYLYLSDYPAGYVYKPTSKSKAKQAPEKTTDVHLYTKSINGKILIDRFYAVLMESSLDCCLYRLRAPPEVQAKVDCVMCTPTGARLFNPNIRADLAAANPCVRPQSQTVSATEISYDGSTYYYTQSPDEGVTIYEWNDRVESYVPIPHTHRNYAALIDMITG